MKKIVVTYGESGSIRQKYFETLKQAKNFCDNEEITPFKILDMTNFDCPETIKDFGNYKDGKWSASRFMGVIKAV